MFFYYFNSTLWTKLRSSLVTISDDTDAAFAKNRADMVLCLYILYFRLDNMFWLKILNLVNQVIEFLDFRARLDILVELFVVLINILLPIKIIRYHPTFHLFPFMYNLHVLYLYLYSHLPVQTWITGIKCWLFFIRIIHFILSRRITSVYFVLVFRCAIHNVKSSLN